MAQSDFEDGCRSVQENAHGAAPLTLLGAILLALSLLGLVSGLSKNLLLVVVFVVMLLAGIALLYVGVSLRRDARKALLHQQEASDPWERGRSARR